MSQIVMVVVGVCILIGVIMVLRAAFRIQVVGKADRALIVCKRCGSIAIHAGPGVYEIKRPPSRCSGDCAWAPPWSRDRVYSQCGGEQAALRKMRSAIDKTPGVLSLSPNARAIYDEICERIPDPERWKQKQLAAARKQ